MECPRLAGNGGQLAVEADDVAFQGGGGVGVLGGQGQVGRFDGDRAGGVGFPFRGFGVGGLGEEKGGVGSLAVGQGQGGEVARGQGQAAQKGGDDQGVAPQAFGQEGEFRCGPEFRRGGQEEVEKGGGQEADGSRQDPRLKEGVEEGADLSGDVGVEEPRAEGAEDQGSAEVVELRPDHNREYSHARTNAPAVTRSQIWRTARRVKRAW